MLKLALLATLLATSFAADATVKAAGDNLQVIADGTITLQADGGTMLKVSDTDITMVPANDASKSKTFSSLANDLAMLVQSNDDMATLLKDLKANYSAMTTNLATMQTQYADTNKGYVTTLNDLKSQIAAFASTTTADVRRQYQSALATYNSSSDSTTSLVGSLISRFSDLTTTRQTSQAAAVALLDAAVVAAEEVLNNATSDSSAYAATATSSAGQSSDTVAAASKILTDAVTDTNTAVTAGTQTITAAAKSITDLSADINTKLGPKIAGITSATTTLDASVSAMMAELDDSFFSLENSINRMRAIINTDFTAYNETTFVPDLVDAGDYFAWCSDSLGDTVVTGAPYFNGFPKPASAATRVGGAFVYTYNRSSNKFEQDTFFQGERNGDLLGHDVAIAQDGRKNRVIAVGAPFWEPVRKPGAPFMSASGVLYVYTEVEGVWNLSQTITAPDAGSGDNFGRAVDISCQGLDFCRMVTSAPYHDYTAPDGTTTINQGLLYIYERVNAESDFVFKASLLAPDSATSDSLGLHQTSLTIAGDYILAGAAWAEAGGSGEFSHGRAYMWHLKSLPGADGKYSRIWTLDTTFKLDADKDDSYDYFGAAVHMCLKNGMPLVVIGSYGDDNNNATHTGTSATGAAYVYAKTSAGYTAPTVVRDPDLTQNGNFGIDAGFDRTCSRLAVGGNGQSTYNGAVYTYNVGTNGAVSYVGKAVSSKANPYDYAGRGLTWGDDFIGFGGYGSDVKGSLSGNFFAMTKIDIV